MRLVGASTCDKPTICYKSERCISVPEAMVNQIVRAAWIFFTPCAPLREHCNRTVRLRFDCESALGTRGKGLDRGRLTDIGLLNQHPLNLAVACR